MPLAVEEIVRWATPIMTFRRTAARDTELGGQHITEGDKVIMFYSSANRDTEVFDHPEQLDLSRSPNKTWPSAAEVSPLPGRPTRPPPDRGHLPELLTRLPDIHAVGEPEFGNGNFFHTVMSMRASSPRRNDEDRRRPDQVLLDRPVRGRAPRTSSRSAPTEHADPRRDIR